MKFICNGSDLALAFNKVSKAISQKKGIPILEGVKISADGDIVTLTATDTDLTIINKITATVKLEGDVIVDGKLAGELVNKMSGQSIEVDCIDGKITTFKYLDSCSKIKCLNLEEFPPVIEPEGEVVSISKRQFKSVVEKTIFSAASDEMRPVLKGCLIKISGNKLKSVALDGFRLAIASIELDKDYDDMEVIVPSKAMFDITKLIDNAEDSMKITISDKKLMIDMDHTKVITSLIAGQFIRYEHIIPKTFNTSLIAIRQQLDEVLGRVSIFSRREKTSLITLSVNDNILTIKANTQQGDITEKLPISTNGKDITLGINSTYIYECIKAIDDDQLKISITTTNDPCVITPIEGDSYLYLILPIRLVS